MITQLRYIGKKSIPDHEDNTHNWTDINYKKKKKHTEKYHLPLYPFLITFFLSVDNYS